MDRQHIEVPRLAILVPCYNEEETLPYSAPLLLQKLEALSNDNKCLSNSYVVLVDDGSLDGTWTAIEKTQREYGRRVVGIRLAINAGHQNALMAAIDYAVSHSDVSISIDADLQDSLASFDDMLQAHTMGAELVFGVRRSRATDTTVKRTTASLFYRTMAILGVNMVEQHADYRLMSRSAMLNLQQFPEYHLFLRGLVKKLHNRVAIVEYDRLPRTTGETKYTLRKMLSLAVRGVTSFSVVPLRAIGLVGIFVFVAGLMLAVYAFAAGISGATVPGWASISAPLYALGGVMMFSIGILGEYIGKIYEQVKGRPRYLVDEILGD